MNKEETIYQIEKALDITLIVLQNGVTILSAECNNTIDECINFDRRFAKSVICSFDI